MHKTSRDLNKALSGIQSPISPTNILIALYNQLLKISKILNMLKQTITMVCMALLIIVKNAISPFKKCRSPN